MKMIQICIVTVLPVSKIDKGEEQKEKSVSDLRTLSHQKTVDQCNSCSQGVMGARVM